MSLKKPSYGLQVLQYILIVVRNRIEECVENFFYNLTIPCEGMDRLQVSIWSLYLLKRDFEFQFVSQWSSQRKHQNSQKQSHNMAPKRWVSMCILLKMRVFIFKAANSFWGVSGTSTSTVSFFLFSVWKSGDIIFSPKDYSTTNIRGVLWAK